MIVLKVHAGSNVALKPVKIFIERKLMQKEPVSILDS